MGFRRDDIVDAPVTILNSEDQRRIGCEEHETNYCREFSGFLCGLYRDVVPTRFSQNHQPMVRVQSGRCQKGTIL